MHQPFRFLDLPPELREEVYQKHYESFEPSFELERNNLRLLDALDCNLELACKAIHQEVQRYKNSAARCLRIKSDINRPALTGVSQYLCFIPSPTSNMNATSPTLGLLLRERLETLDLHLSDVMAWGLAEGISMFSAWKNLIHGFAKLRFLNVDSHREGTIFPMVDFHLPVAETVEISYLLKGLFDEKLLSPFADNFIDSLHGIAECLEKRTSSSEWHVKLKCKDSGKFHSAEHDVQMVVEVLILPESLITISRSFHSQLGGFSIDQNDTEGTPMFTDHRLGRTRALAPRQLSSAFLLPPGCPLHVIWDLPLQRSLTN